MINKIEFSTRNLTSNAGLLLLFEHASKNGIFDLIDHGFAVQDGLRRRSRIPAANQDIPIEVHFLGREDYQNGEKCGDEAF